MLMKSILDSCYNRINTLKIHCLVIDVALSNVKDSPLHRCIALDILVDDVEQAHSRVVVL